MLRLPHSKTESLRGSLFAFSDLLEVNSISTVPDADVRIIRPLNGSFSEVRRRHIRCRSGIHVALNNAVSVTYEEKSTGYSDRSESHFLVSRARGIRSCQTSSPPRQGAQSHGGRDSHRNRSGVWARRFDRLSRLQASPFYQASLDWAPSTIRHTPSEKLVAGHANAKTN